MKPKTSARRPRATKQLPIVWTDRALSDLEAIGDYIARDDRSAAARWVARLVRTAEKTAKAPLAGRRVPELNRDDVRETFLRTYRLVYRVSATRIEIITVFEGHRLFPDGVEITSAEPDDEG